MLPVSQYRTFQVYPPSLRRRQQCKKCSLTTYVFHSKTPFSYSVKSRRWGVVSRQNSGKIPIEKRDLFKEIREKSKYLWKRRNLVSGNSYALFIANLLLFPLPAYHSTRSSPRELTEAFIKNIKTATSFRCFPSQSSSLDLYTDCIFCTCESVWFDDSS